MALIGGPTADSGSALARAAAVAAALALENARISAEVREQAEAVRESRKRLLAVADEERQALAARLRAGPGEQLQTVDQLLAGLDGESASDIRGQLASAVTDLEQLALGLFPATLGGRPIGVLVREIAAGMPVPVQIDVDGPVEDLPPGLRALTYFFCSECLANMAKHSGASAATVRVNATAGCLTISVGDDGRGGASLASSRGLRAHLRADPGILQGERSGDRRRAGQRRTRFGGRPADQRHLAPAWRWHAGYPAASGACHGRWLDGASLLVYPAPARYGVPDLQLGIGERAS